MHRYATKHEGVQMVVVFPRGQLSADDKAKLSKGGVLAVEADTPSEVSILSLIPGSSAEVSADDLWMAALRACTDGNEGQRFARELYRLQDQRRTKEPAP